MQSSLIFQGYDNVKSEMQLEMIVVRCLQVIWNTHSHTNSRALPESVPYLGNIGGTMMVEMSLQPAPRLQIASGPAGNVSLM